MADQQDAALLERADSQSSVVNVRQPRPGPSDLKIAGFVCLACMLIAGQALTAYLVLSQKSQISSLEDTTDRLKLKMMMTPKGGPVREVRMPMFSAPMMTLDLGDADTDKGKKTPQPKEETKAIVSLENQVKDLLKDIQLPQFNETFMANLQALRNQLSEPDWQGFESWMRHWLIFQLAQQKPPEPTPTPMSASGLKTKCQLDATKKRLVGLYTPQCDEEGNYKPIQCWHSTGYCWCVDINGNEIPGTMVRGRPVCGGMAAIDRVMPAPSLTRLMVDKDE
ncbi:hypothetical protein GJAV_G00195620 [Gymnothorax javanicus]|nr:hypothetical protein GJAV_G00195620 [Gymnothorax javanicus]